MAELVPVDPFDLIIFGGAGDLAMRKLLPSLYHRDQDGQFSADSRIIAVGRSPIDRDSYLKQVAQAVDADRSDEALDDATWDRFAARLQYFDLDARDTGTWGALSDCLAGHEHKIRAIYLATPPTLFGPVAQGFGRAGLMTDSMRLVLEKPVGSDFASAKSINDAVGECFSESQIFRIDHYLGKETVQNLMVLRFGNSLFEPLWRREAIDHVQITVAEELGVGNRIEFYNEIGAMRDMIQNHLLQLLCLVAMEPPASLDDDAVRDEKIKVLRTLKPIGREQVKSHTVRGQYSGGAIGDAVVPGYLTEFGAKTDTETFVALKLEIDNWRWARVPFYLRTGKRLKVKHSEITIQFKPVPHSIFPESSYAIEPNRLSILLQPDEGVQLKVMAKKPGPGSFDLRPVSLDLSFEETFGIRYPDAYERLLIEVLRGNPALFMRRDEVEGAWQWVDRILAGWRDEGTPPETYAAGTWGPTLSTQLLERDGRSWLALE
ncbi:MAG: glucose-6-phosphate dehydrogenase [Pseudomonadota bacterium]